MISPVHIWTAEKTGLGNDLDPSSLAGWQAEKLSAVIRYAHKNSRYYRERITGFENLQQLPFTSPSDLSEDPFAFLAVSQNRVARVTSLANSGTTILRKRIFFSTADIDRTVDFFAAGMSTMVTKGDHVQILISNKTENSLGSMLSRGLELLGVTSGISGPLRNVGRALEVSREADCIVGMPAEVLYMCRTEPGLRPKAVLLAADIATPAVIDAIRQTWKCEVFTHYGHSEFGFGCAVDCCAHDGLHLRDAGLIFEIIDPATGMPAVPGESGEIVITTLSNEAMPLLRYRTGNISAMIDTPCSCGSSLQRLGRIEGRYNNELILRTGHILSIYDLDEILLNDARILGFEAKYESATGILHLTIDSPAKTDLPFLEKSLPEELVLNISYGKADPFTSHRKRRIELI